MHHVYLTQALIEEALRAHIITEQEARELIALIAEDQPDLLQAS